MKLFYQFTNNDCQSSIDCGNHTGISFIFPIDVITFLLLFDIPDIHIALDQNRCGSILFNP